MKYYEAFLKCRCFRFEDAKQLIGSEDAALTILRRYIKKGYVVRIRRGLYAAIDLLDHEPAANQYLIASSLSETAVVSHHAAFAWHGVANQVSYEIGVTSEMRFNPFTFWGYRFRRLAPQIKQGVVQASDGSRITDLERTVLDSINDFESEMGFEELMQCIILIPILNEKKLIAYLEEYDSCFLYQKTGFILERFQQEFMLSDAFLTLCRERSGKSSRYLMSGIPAGYRAFCSKWHLTIPKDLWISTLKGEDEDVDV